MSLELPERPSYEFLRKLAKDRFAALRTTAPNTRLASVQLALAREYGFHSWRALKLEIDRRRASEVAAFTQACSAGDVSRLLELLESDSTLSKKRLDNGSTGLHLAARHSESIRVLLRHGADPNARDAADNATPLHFAAGCGNLKGVLSLLNAGADVHGHGDLHRGGVIGWAARKGNEAVVQCLLEHGARHHIFSAMALGDRRLVEALVLEDPDWLSFRRSKFECEQPPLHASFAPPEGLNFLAGEPD
jgi:ankyrin repeat protein